MSEKALQESTEVISQEQTNDESALLGNILEKEDIDAILKKEIIKELACNDVQEKAVEKQLTQFINLIERLRRAKNEKDTDKVDPFIQYLLDAMKDVRNVPSLVINAMIDKIDLLISDQLNMIMHHSEFQKIEASWRGLNYLVTQTNTGEQLKIKVLNVSKQELLKDMEPYKKYDQSEMFKKVYEEEYGTPGGEAYGALIGDYEFSNHPQDIGLLKKISEVAAAAHAPYISAASPGLLSMKSFTDIPSKYKLETIFSKPEYAQWRSFRDSEDSRYVSLVLPHVLLRLPYGEKTDPVESFTFEEAVSGKDHKRYLWGNAAYALAVRITEAFDKYGWCVAIRGAEGGGKVENLPAHIFEHEGASTLKCPTEIEITNRREKELADLGFITLSSYKHQSYAAFISTQTTNKPKKNNDSANLSSQLQYMLAVSRFAHYLKSIMRDKVGSFMSREETERFLNQWISQYVGNEQKARFPLKEARIDVCEIPGKPGAYNAVAYLRPHYQLNEINVSIRMVAKIEQK